MCVVCSGCCVICAVHMLLTPANTNPSPSPSPSFSPSPPSPFPLPSLCPVPLPKAERLIRLWGTWTIPFDLFMSHFAHLGELTTKGVGLAVVQDIAAVEGGERIGAYLGENRSRSSSSSSNRI